MSNKFGAPYQGSKSTLAKWIVDKFPPADNFVDVFCGGGAVTHAAIESGKYKHFVLNDQRKGLAAFIRDCFLGRLPEDRYRWISREEFHVLKTTDPLIACVWSFGNNYQDYLYSKEIEPYKRAMWNVVYGKTPSERRVAIRTMIAELAKFMGSKKALSAKAQDLEQLQSLKSLERLERLERLDCTDATDRFSVYCLDYADVPIPPNSVIYCDPPYKGTRRYDDKPFDHERFYAWAEAQEQPIFISEKEMP